MTPSPSSVQSGGSSDRKVFDLREEPRGQRYRDLISEAQAQKCSTALLVVQESAHPNERVSELLAHLAPFLLRSEQSKEWPGTKLLEDSAQVFHFALNDMSAHLLGSAVDGLFDWQHPDRPEDLCLLRRDDSPWLVTIAHERDAYLELDDDERRLLVLRVGDLLV